MTIDSVINNFKHQVAIDLINKRFNKAIDLLDTDIKYTIEHQNHTLVQSLRDDTKEIIVYQLLLEEIHTQPSLKKLQHIVHTMRSNKNSIRDILKCCNEIINSYDDIHLIEKIEQGLCDARK